MYYQCLSCENSFDATIAPLSCPICGAASGFAEISVTTADGLELTYAEHMKDMREYYLSHLPDGMIPEDINNMSDRELEDMDDIMSE